MLLEAILKHSVRANLSLEAKALEMAFQVMTVVPNQANDMMDIGRLQGFEVRYETCDVNNKNTLYSLLQFIFHPCPVILTLFTLG